MALKSKVTPEYFLSDVKYNASKEREQNIIGRRIAELRKLHNLSLVNLSEVLTAYGVHIRPNAISKWEMGDSLPNAYQIITLCKVFDIKNPDFFTVDGVISDLNEIGIRKLAEYKADLLATGKYAPSSFKGNIIYIDMPVSNLRVSAGTGTFLDGDNFETISVPKESVPAGAQFGIRVSGDSMTPVYHDGQIVWVQECRELRSGEVGIFIYDGEGYIKVYSEQEPDDPTAFTDSYGVCHMQPIMISYNSAYAPKVIQPTASFQIVGRVLK